MKRALVTLAAAALAAVGLTSPAAAGQIYRSHVVGPDVLAQWAVESDTSFVSTIVQVWTVEKGVYQLHVDRYSAAIDASGNWVDQVRTSIDVTSGFSITIDTVKLTSGQLSAINVPATTCDETSDGTVITSTCVTEPMNLNVTWTGEGPISRGGWNEHYNLGDLSYNIHAFGTSRSATATATVDGSTMDPATYVTGWLANSKWIETDVSH